VKVSDRKGIANQTGPESCVAHREVRDEALTGELAGQPLSRESFKLVQGADAVSVAEGNTTAGNCSEQQSLVSPSNPADSITPYAATFSGERHRHEWRAGPVRKQFGTKFQSIHADAGTSMV
jgi:hypothetical protein